MGFIESYTLFDKIIPFNEPTISTFTYLYEHGQYTLDQNGDLEPKDDIIPLDGSADINNLEFLEKYNRDEYLTILNVESIVKKDIEMDGECPKYERQLDFIIRVKAIFKYWYRCNDLEVPKLSKQLVKSKKERFYNDFVRLVESDSTTEKEVRETLYDIDFYKTPATYIRRSRARYGISTTELKSRPGFGFLDPKNTTHN